MTRSVKVRKKTVQSSPHYIVGIGASAGGIEAFKELLQNLPNDSGMAFVIIQHLSPKHESLLPKILARETTMPVLEVKTGMKTLPNHVFVIPPNTFMQINNGVLELLARDPKNRIPLPIDAFFKSLSADQKEKAIGIVLSGTGADGAEGTKIIKAADGITFAQSPGSAQYPSMPRSAIQIDDIDFVLSPSRIADELTRISQVKNVQVVEQDGVANIIRFLKRQTGTDFSQYKQSTVQRRIKRRLLLNKMETFRQYLDLINSGGPESSSLHDDLLINVTSFFREPESLVLLKMKMLPEWLASESNEPLRIWVAGCATGEEAYSIAIIIAEFFEKENIRKPVQIFATDLSDKCINRARLGKYEASIAAQMSPERLRKYFTKVGTGYRANKNIRDFCVFAKHDLTRDAPYSKLDLISCRNVLIYFAQPLQNKLMEMFHYSVKENGFLLLGESENIGMATDLFVSIDPKRKLYSKKISFQKNHPITWHTSPHPSAESIKKPTVDVNLASIQIQAEIDRTILMRYSPPAIVINSNYDILQFRGNTDAFLSHRIVEGNLNLLRVLREGLVSEIQKLIVKAKKKEGPVRKEGLKFARGKVVSIEISALTLLGGKCFLVVFDENILPVAKNKAASKSSNGLKLNLVNELEEELRATREKLQYVIHDLENANQGLQSANEEVISANEELQSTNEELETSKEELQSTNEELNTVNDELQSRNQELFVLNNDLVNLLNSIYIPVIIVGNDLAIRRFTPTASRIINIKTGDVGRPISDITSDIINVKLLTASIQEVIENATIFAKEIQDQQGHWHQLRIRPYKTQDQKLDGAVVTLFDIDQFKGRPKIEESNFNE